MLALVAGLAGGWPGSALARPAATAAALVGGFDATAVARAVLRGERRSPAAVGCQRARGGRRPVLAG